MSGTDWLYMHLMPVLSCCVLVVAMLVTTEEEAWRQKRDQLFGTTEGYGERMTRGVRQQR